MQFYKNNNVLNSIGKRNNTSIFWLKPCIRTWKRTLMSFINYVTFLGLFSAKNAKNIKIHRTIHEIGISNVFWCILQSISSEFNLEFSTDLLSQLKLELCKSHPWFFLIIENSHPHLLSQPTLVVPFRMKQYSVFRNKIFIRFYFPL